MDDDRLDLSPLHPWPDGPSLDAVAARVAARGMALRPAPRAPSLPDLLAAWRRPALVLAALLALVAVPLMLLVESPAPGPDGREAGTVAVVDWAWSGQVQPLDLLDDGGR